MKLNLREKYEVYEPWFLLGALLIVSGNLAYEVYLERNLFPAATLHLLTDERKAFLLFVMTLVFVFFRQFYNRIKRIQETQDWFIDAVNANYEILNIKIHELAKHKNDIFCDVPQSDKKHPDQQDPQVDKCEIHKGGLNVSSYGHSALAENIEPTEKPSRWPWGEHHTEYLGHLEAAARRYWRLYDPSDATTAPTNEVVANWLHSERKISKEKAKAIASMLRPDGLPTGPRK